MSRIAFVLADDFEDSEFKVPFDCLSHAGHEITVIGCEAGKEVKGKQRKERARIDQTAADVSVDDFDALVIPGGGSPDKLRLDEDIVAFTKAMFESGKTVAAICHGPQLLIEAGVVEGLTMTSWPSVRTDLENAGARWVNLEVSECHNLITSRKPEDLPAFCDKVLERVGAGSRA